MLVRRSSFDMIASLASALALAPLAMPSACARSTASADAGGDAAQLVASATPSAAPSGNAAAPPPTDSPDGGAAPAPVPGGEAERAEIAKLDADPELAGQAELVKKHFGAATGPFLVQRIPLRAGRRMLLVSSRDESDPLLLALDGKTLLWSKERPTAGMVPPAIHLAITTHPSGGAVLFAYDAPTKVVAARVWEADGAPFADFQVMKVDACDDLSAARWPERGWVVACAWLGGARAQLLKEEGTMAWRRDGADVGAAWRAPAPVSIAFDGDAALVLVQYGEVRPAAAGDHVVATRYDAKGRPLWTAPVDLGSVPTVTNTRARIPVKSLGGVGVRVELGHGAIAIVDASGHKTARPKQGLEP